MSKALQDIDKFNRSLLEGELNESDIKNSSSSHYSETDMELINNIIKTSETLDIPEQAKSTKNAWEDLLCKIDTETSIEDINNEITEDSKLSDLVEESLENLDVPSAKTTNEAWNEFLNTIGESEESDTQNTNASSEAKVVSLHSTTEQTKKKSNNMLTWGLTMAAAIALVAVSVFVFNNYNQNNDQFYATLKGEKYTMFLPDSSKVIINANSRIAYNQKTWDKERNVKLSGEAIFEVKKGSAFTVSSDLGSVSVLGTKFDVNSRDSIFEVECYSGKVKVKSKGDEKILTKGKATQLHDGKLAEAFDINIEKSSAWVNGNFYFQSESLNKVINVIENQFNVTVSTDVSTGQLYTGHFTDKNLEQALDLVCIPMGLRFEINNNKVRIYR
ncbi:FecR family protein [Aureibacter tunicatorum]|uniref:Ferric-dicitrate binding protein FerR (Iron transport regulator) n=1 Tax=Aureibacter tunicatorum TaxID=866807 RepID=A0AAE3XR22_9BACT|nr:FecR family protein [Aureibacter tunicatorum]MDR6240346.1 ferric-dicitrate binding protein FerR (iron transport regulator) [Aureibacter tunicatorum]BDD05773.1 hypothetical protein AUTU_32560 [Aureibacter tunicatorum]